MLPASAQDSCQQSPPAFCKRPVVAMVFVFRKMDLQHFATASMYRPNTGPHGIWHMKNSGKTFYIWEHDVWSPDFMSLFLCMQRTWRTSGGAVLPFEEVQCLIWQYVGRPTTAIFLRGGRYFSIGNPDSSRPARQVSTIVIPTLTKKMAQRVVTQCLLWSFDTNVFGRDGVADLLSRVQSVADEEVGNAQFKLNHYPGGMGAMLVTWEAPASPP